MTLSQNFMVIIRNILLSKRNLTQEKKILYDSIHIKLQKRQIESVVTENKLVIAHSLKQKDCLGYGTRKRFGVTEIFFILIMMVVTEVLDLSKLIGVYIYNGSIILFVNYIIVYVNCRIYIASWNVSCEKAQIWGIFCLLQ